MLEFVKRFLDGVEFDFVRYRYIAATISGLLVAASWAVFIAIGPNWGIDFTGGTEIMLKFEEATDISEVRTALRELGLSDDTVQSVNGFLQVEIAAKIPGRREESVDEAEVDEAVEQLLSPRMRHLFDDEGNAHLQRRHGDRAPALKAMLSAASATDVGVPRATLLTAGMRGGLSGRSDAERALLQLADEFYLAQHEGRYRFQNPLFRRWWERFGHWR